MMEHRWGERLKVSIQARLFVPGVQVSQSGCLMDMSASGAFISTGVKPQLLQRLEVEFRAPTRTGFEVISMPACVVRRTAIGVGVEWCEALSVAIRDLIGAILIPDRRLTQLAKPRTLAPAPAPSTPVVPGCAVLM